MFYFAVFEKDKDKHSYIFPEGFDPSEKNDDFRLGVKEDKTVDLKESSYIPWEYNEKEAKKLNVGYFYQLKIAKETTVNPSLAEKVFTVIGEPLGREQYETRSKLAIVDFHIYSNGDITRRNPKGEITQARYYYHSSGTAKDNPDDTGGREIYVAPLHKTSAKKAASKTPATEAEIEKHKTDHGVESDSGDINEGDTKRRIIFNNGDVAEYGIHSSYGQEIWRIYKAGDTEIELVKMSAIAMPKDFNLDGELQFSGTERKYTSPAHLAGLIGTIIETKVTIKSTGSCFERGSCFPSLGHVNGESIDLEYIGGVHTVFNQDQQSFLDALHKFGFNDSFRGYHTYAYNHTKLVDKDPGKGKKSLHDSHLHSPFNESKIIKR